MYFLLGFMYCISHCSVYGVDAYFEGEAAGWGVSVDGSDPLLLIDQSGEQGLKIAQQSSVIIWRRCLFR